MLNMEELLNQILVESSCNRHGLRIRTDEIIRGNKSTICIRDNRPDI